MKQKIWVWMVGFSISLLLMVALAKAPINPLSVAGYAPGTDYVPGQILVMVSPNRLKVPKGTTPNVLPEKVVFELEHLYRQLGYQVVNEYALPDRMRDQNLPPLNNPEVCGGTLLTLSIGGLSVDAMVEAVTLATQNYLRGQGYNPPNEGFLVVPNDGFTRPDALMPSDPSIPSVNLNGLANSAQGVRVAIIDSGFVLPPNVTSTLPGFTTIHDSDSEPPSFNGWQSDEITILDAVPSPVYGHGTPVLGIIASIAKGATFIPIKACNARGFCTGKSVTLGLCYAAYQHAKVINASFGGFYSSPLVKAAVRDVIDVGGLVVAGAGNSRNLAWNLSREDINRGRLRDPNDLIRGWNKPVYPAAWSEQLFTRPARRGDLFVFSHADGLLSVGSTNSLGQISKFSSLSPNIDIVTFGENVETEFSLDSSFNHFVAARRSGTSFAAPIISGIAAVMRGQRLRERAGITELTIVGAGERQAYECVLDLNMWPVLNDCRLPNLNSTAPQILVSQLDMTSLRSLLY